MEIKHFNQGSDQPIIKNDTINLYSMRFCPYAHRVHLVLHAKSITFNPIYINLESKPTWYTDIFPAGRVPALHYKGHFLHESLLLADFLNEEFPSNPLYPDNPLEKMKDRMVIENFNQVSSAFYRVAMDKFDQNNFGDLLNALEVYEKELNERNTKFFGGNERPMMVDCMIWPWFERIPALAVLYGDEAKFPAEKFPLLSQWMELMKHNPTIEFHYLTPEQHAKHFILRKAKDPGAFDGIY